MSELVAGDTLEHIERRGLIRVLDEANAAEVHFTHALIGEVIRTGLGHVASRRLRSELVSAMRTHPPRSPAVGLRRAELAMRADEPVDADLLMRRSP